MDRVFDYEEARQLCAFHRQKIETCRRILASHSKNAEKLVKAARKVLGSKSVSSAVETALTTGHPETAQQPEEKELFHAVYVCDESNTIASAVRNMEQLQQEIRRDIIALERVCSPIKWFLSGRDAKSAADSAFQRLSELEDGNYSRLINDLEERSGHLDSVSVDTAIDIVSGNEQAYLPCLGKWAPDLVRQNGFPSGVKERIRKVKEPVLKYQNALKDQDYRIETAKSGANRAINPVIMERTLQELRNQDLDVLSRKRSGIRLKALRDGGYRNVADVYTAPEYQLASLYGIGTDSASQIKETADEIARDVSKTIKLKISSDERTSAATALLREAYQYDLACKASMVIAPEIRTHLDDVVKQLSSLALLHNNIWWTFSNLPIKRKCIQAYQLLETGLTPEEIAAIQDFCRELQRDISVSDQQLWEDFDKRSADYFGLLEKLCPSAFGNDDTLYGLPEDLAQEIQEQAYFPNGLKVTLRRYQEWGVKYILHQGKVLLGDEMGLGKTVQAIAAMVSLRNTGARKFLVVCPASVLPNWCKEIGKKSMFHPVKVHGTGRQAAFDSWNRNGGVAVTTYETLSTLQIPSGLEYDLLVVDEAHFIKNVNAQRSQAVRMIGTYTKRLLYMTGTALENKVDEMISLLQPLNPKVAGQAERLAFMSTAPLFRQTIAPVYYRRKREDVLTELPDITYSNEWCDLLPQEREAYTYAVFAKNRSAIRKVSWVTSDLEQSAKARRLREIVDEAESDGRKTLVFSNYLETIDRVREMLGDRCTQPINGSVDVNRRQAIIDEFEKMPAGSVLPLQIQAGGTGLNIQAASVVVICEPQLKPSIENQAVSRAYRMGQSRKVLVYRLLATDTIDERIDDMLSAKQAVFDAFADISEAADATQQEEQQIDDKTFGKLIQDEIDRINLQAGHAPLPVVPPEPENRDEEGTPENPQGSS